MCPSRRRAHGAGRLLAGMLLCASAHGASVDPTRFLTPADGPITEVVPAIRH
jgi:hypothetical protein